jgi:hypothetical protein
MQGLSTELCELCRNASVLSNGIQLVRQLDELAPSWRTELANVDKIVVAPANKDTFIATKEKLDGLLRSIPKQRGRILADPFDAGTHQAVGGLVVTVNQGIEELRGLKPKGELLFTFSHKP